MCSVNQMDVSLSSECNSRINKCNSRVNKCNSHVNEY